MKLLVLAGLLAFSVFGAERPNIVIIVADDLGWRDVSYHGGEIRTPHIDRFASDGVRLERFYVAPVCSPTRAGLMTGRYPIRFGAMRAVYPPWREGGLDISEVTLAEVLSRAGYTHRGVFGKWHLGHSSVKYHPLRRGFTEFVGHYNGAIDYFTHEREGALDWHHNYEPVREEGYGTDLTADYAIRFIKKQASGQDPFLCYVPFNAPHSPFQAKPEHLEPYRTLPLLPGRWEGKDAARLKNRRLLAGMVASLDENIGRILAAIDEAGISDNTLVWFFSDNGGVGGIGDNRPLLGAKATVYEGGIRVAAAVRWPGRIPAGETREQPIANIDVLPTLMGIAGIENHGGKPLDGIDVREVLTGERETLDREIYSYIGQSGEENEQVAVLDGEWKLVVSGPDISRTVVSPNVRRELFRVRGSAPEKGVSAAEQREIVERLFEKARRFRTLQPPDAVPPYGEGREEFQPPADWRPPDL